MKFKFVRSEPVTSDVTSFIFEPEQPVSWQPGQYFHYLLPHTDEDDRGHERWFTNSAAPAEGNVMISTRLNSEHSSTFKTALQALQTGDEIEADGPEGDFTVEDPARNYIFVAGGIGITPFRSILTEAARNGQQLHVQLLYANRNQEIPFAEELDQLAATNPHLTIEYIVNPQRIDAGLIKDRAAAMDNPLIYLSGPEPMVKGLAKDLAELDVPEAQIKLDDFPGYEEI
jgi:ferredoxin-NADP reductase